MWKKTPPQIGAMMQKKRSQGIRRRTIPFILSIAVFAIAATSFTFAGGNGSPKKNAPQLDQAQREAIVKAATQAFANHVKGERKKEMPDEIDKAHWGESIAKLKPLRVRNDRVNIAIVLAENAGIEEGLYVSNPISSYLPQLDERFQVFTQLSTDKDKSFGTLYYYKLKPKAK
jgi:hypothetical protein